LKNSKKFIYSFFIFYYFFILFYYRIFNLKDYPDEIGCWHNLDHNNTFWTGDETLFIKKASSDIILVQVYVDIIFGSTNEKLCEQFVATM